MYSSCEAKFMSFNTSLEYIFRERRESLPSFSTLKEKNIKGEESKKDSNMY